MGHGNSNQLARGNSFGKGKGSQMSGLQMMQWPGLPSAMLEKLAHAAVKRAIAALEAAALKGEVYISQVGALLLKFRIHITNWEC